jgi:O-antigen ligase
MRAILANVALFISLARGEMRLAFAGATGVAWRTLIAGVWALTAIVLGTLVGFMAVILPPTPIFIVILVFAVVMLWVLPDLPTAPDTLIRRMLLVALIVNLIIPTYYTVQVASLPWISARRVVTFPLIVLFAITFSTSRDARRRIAEVIAGNRLTALCVFGFPIAAFLSVFTSIAPAASMSALVDMLIEVYSFFVLILYVIKSDEDVEFLVRLIMWCALFVSAVAPLDTFLHKHTFVAILPQAIVNNLLANNPTFASMMTGQSRAGLYRAASIFGNALSFAEFEAIMTPLALVFAMNGRTWKDRSLGGVLFVACLLGIFFSGSRGGYVSAIAGLAVLGAVWVIRSYRLDVTSLKPAVGGSLSGAGLILLILAILFVPAVHNRVLGGGAEEQSNEGRRIQWEMATPKLIRNPLTGYGFELAGEIVGYRPCDICNLTVDSYVLSTLAETGILGFATFFGSIVISAFFGLRRYIFDQTWAGSLAGGLACALVAYFTNKLVLSQRENINVINIMVGCIMFLNYHFIKDTVGKSAARLSKEVMGLKASSRARRQTGGRSPTRIPSVAPH